MGPPSYMRSVVDRNVVMLRIPVYVAALVNPYATRRISVKFRDDE